MIQEKIGQYLNDNLDISQRKEKNSLYIEIAENLSYGNKDEISSTIAAINKVEKETGKEPEYEPYVIGQPNRCLSQDVREGYVSPTEDAINLYKTTMGKDLPGLGEPSDQEIAATDAEIGFKSAGFQTGHKLSGPDKMLLEETEGQNPEGVGAKNPDPVDMSFGPSKVIKGALTGNINEVIQGLKETNGVGAGKSLGQSLEAFQNPGGMIKQLFDTVKELQTSASKNGLANTIVSTMQEGLTAKNDKDTKDAKEQGLASNLMEELTKGSPAVEGFKFLADTIARGSQALSDKSEGYIEGQLNSLLDSFKPNSNGTKSAMESKGESDLTPKLKGEGKEKEDDKEEPSGKPLSSKKPEGNEALAGWIARGVTYSLARKRGINPKDAGEMAECAGKNAEEASKESLDSQENVNKALEGVKSVKNAAAKGLSTAAQAIQPPGVGKAVAIGIAIADKASDFILDLVNPNDNNKKVMEQAGNLEGGQAKQSEGTPKSIGGNEAPNQGVTSNEIMSMGAFREQITKEKKGLMKKLIPNQDILASGATTAINSVGSWGIDEVNKAKAPQKADEMHKSIDSPA